AGCAVLGGSGSGAVRRWRVPMVARAESKYSATAPTTDPLRTMGANAPPAPPDPVPPSAEAARRAERERVNANKLSKRLIRETAKAISDYNMLEDGDKVQVCQSGGKDTYAPPESVETPQNRATL